jgi:O-antigen ligase
VIAFFQKQKIFRYYQLKYIFTAQIFILYFSMIIHTDIKAINSPTIVLMLISSLIIFSNKISSKSINIFSIALAYVNFLIVLLQVLNYIPVAQDNIREGLNIITDRPTGLLFNAFAMGYGAVITFSISAFFIKEKKLVTLNLLAAAFSIISIIFSVTRTPLLLIAISVLLILIQNTSFANKYWKLITISMPALLLAFPLVSVLVGNSNGNQDMATLNGRTFLWNCVTSKWDQFVPFGVGVQGAFPQGFCSDDEWFSKLRHPENMFLLNFVESGILGIVGLVLLFVITFWFSGKALQRGSGLPMAITSTFLLSSIFYVPLFHYLPFLENRTADRGVFNFFLFTLLWMAVMKLFNSETTKQKPKTS